MKRSSCLGRIRSNIVHLTIVILFEKMLVETICNLRAIGISDGPEKNVNTILMYARLLNLPHRCNNSTETSKQQCRTNMHSLIRKIFMAHCCFACTKKSEWCIRNWLLHDAGYLKPAIFENKRALQRVLLILFPMACEVDYWRRWKMRYDFVHRSRSLWNSQLDKKLVGYMGRDVPQFLIRTAKSLGLNDNHHLEWLGGTCRRRGRRKSSEDCTDCRHIGWHHIIRDACGRLFSINASCMYW